MSRAWSILPDGTHRKLSDAEDVESDARVLLEDARETFEALREIAAAAQRTRQESRRLVAAVRAERRLRATRLRVVKSSVP
jgi:hypothetical protein